MLQSLIQQDRVASDLCYIDVRFPQALPYSFVQGHGDKFRKSVILQTESSTKAWPVKISISFSSPSCTQVKFAGGWKSFATFHSLMAGDSLIFSLQAISEFKVYVFPGTGNPKQLPSQPAPTKWSIDSGLPRKKAKQYSSERKSEPLSAEESTEGAGKLNDRIAQKKSIEEQRKASAAFGHSPTSLRNSPYSKDSKSVSKLCSSIGLLVFRNKL
jgi:hypothetical protein